MLIHMDARNNNQRRNANIKKPNWHPFSMQKEERLEFHMNEKATMFITFLILWYREMANLSSYSASTC